MPTLLRDVGMAPGGGDRAPGLATHRETASELKDFSIGGRILVAPRRFR